MPPATTGPGPLIDPPLPGTPLPLSNSRDELYSQSTRPSVVEYARIMPSVVPEKTAPGMTEIAADRDAIQLRAPGAQSAPGGFTSHTRSPLASLTAKSPPACA